MRENSVRNHTTLWDRIIRECNVDFLSIHGPQHWARVERNGLHLAEESGANPDVVAMFALFHDSRRVNDGFDDGHGGRGAAYARQSNALLAFLDETAFEQLIFACTWHTDLVHHEDPTVRTCFDADRLDLGRVGVIPDPAYLNTDGAKKLASGKLLHLLDDAPQRKIRLPDPGGIGFGTFL